MTTHDDFDDEPNDEQDIDEGEAQAAERGANDSGASLSDADVLEAESLTVTAKAKARQQLEDEVSRFLAQGGQITQVAANKPEEEDF